jgi:hypothetical protein
MTNGFCTVCKGKCAWLAHINSHEVIKARFIERKITNQELLDKFNVKNDEKNQS